MIEGDSKEYEILKEACESLTGDDFFTAEVGVRRGLGSKLILMNLEHKRHWHIGIDPYGNLNYQHYDNKKPTTADYTNDMKQELIKDLNYKNFSLFQMEDDEFMKRFADGVPIYREKKEIRNIYDLVHFDGPHRSLDVIRESIFFAERSHSGSVFIYDDYPKYDMQTILSIIVNQYEFMLLKQGKNKISLKRK
tara:strand:+ start:396 stop:974 length:579 start_codon:yes stop_codon:yes gene_type:complete